MENAGFRVDARALQSFGKTLSAALETLEKQIYSYAGKFNINSPKQLGEVLFDKLGIVAVDPHGAMSEKEGTISIKINPATGSGPGPDDLIIDPNSDLNASVKEDGDQPGDPETNQATSVTGQLKAMWKPDTSHEGDPSNRVFGIEGEREGEQGLCGR